MTALELISFITQVLFIGLFVAVVPRALREPNRANLDTVLLFGAIAGVVAVSRIAGWLGIGDEPLVRGAVIVLLAAAPLAMIRLVDDFSDSPRWAQVGGLLGFVALSVVGLTLFERMEWLVDLVAIAFIVAVGGYAALAFARESRRTHGLTRKRMTAVATGALLLMGALMLVFVGALVPAMGEVTSMLLQLMALAASLAFFLGFAAPSWIRRAWREPDLRAFLERSIHLTGVADERAAIMELSQAAAAAFGASGATVAVADPERGVLRYVSRDGDWAEFRDDQFIAGRAYREQRRIVAPDARAADPEHATTYEAFGALTVIAAPISTETRRIGVLTAFAERRPIFVDDDLWLIELLADQVAVLLEARDLAEQATTLRAREEAARLKEEFLSAAAHDLRTPLTVVLGQAELLERRLRRNPDAPVDPAGVARIVREARRLSDLVTELLDAQRLDQGAAVLDLVPADLLATVDQVRDRYADGGVTVVADGLPGPLIAAIDRPRIEQVLDNLAENALKYTPNGDPPEIHVTEANGVANVSVVDHGIGIPEAEHGRIFERFFRASNAQGITDTGLGLGLFICRRIIEEHGGEIRFAPTPGGGTTFSFTLPLIAPADSSVAPTPVGETWQPSQRREAGADA